MDGIVSYLAHGGYGPSLVFVVALSVAAWVLARSTSRDPWSTAMLVATLSAIPASTLVRSGNQISLSWSGIWHWAPSGLTRLVATAPWSPEILLNAALFLPAGTAVVALRKSGPGLGLVGLAILSAVIELAQGVLGIGLPDISDLIANVVGALLGTCLGCGLLVIRRAGGRQHRAWLFTAGVATSVFVLTVPMMARSYLNHLTVEARDRFGGKTYFDYRQLQRDPRVNDKVFRLDGTFSDGVRLSDHEAQVRFPANYLGVRQCIVVMWARSQVSVVQHKDALCSVAYD